MRPRCAVGKDSSGRYRDGSVGPRGFPGAPLSAGELFDIFSNHQHSLFDQCLRLDSSQEQPWRIVGWRPQKASVYA